MSTDIQHRMRTAHVLNGSCAGQGPQIRVADPRKLVLDGLQHVARNLQTGIGGILALAEPAVTRLRCCQMAWSLGLVTYKARSWRQRQPAAE